MDDKRAKEGGHDPVIKYPAKPCNILNYLEKNGCKRWTAIVQYMTEDIKKEGISTIGKSTVSKWLRILCDTQKVTRQHTAYCLAESKSQDTDTTTGFSEGVGKDLNLAKSLQETAFLLEATLLLLDKIRPSDDSHETIISEKKEECKAHLAGVGKIIAKNSAYSAVQRENEYSIMVNEAQKSYKEKYLHGMLMKTYNTANFRDAFSDVILRIRQRCKSMHSASPTTYEESAVSDSCKLVSTSLNKICRVGYDLVVCSYEYDEELDMFKIDMSELRGTSYEISRLYLDGKKHRFNAVVSEPEPGMAPCLDCTVEFYPEVETDKTEHTLTVMVGCVEFSFEITGNQRLHEMGLLNHMGDDDAEIDPVYPQYESDVVLLTPQSGGEIKDIIESHRNAYFVCLWCDRIHHCNRWIGRPDGGGMPDGSGNKYRMVIKCDGTGRENPLRRIQENIYTRSRGDSESPSPDL